jgi:8-oxo-dGTP diphosphatase
MSESKVNLYNLDLDDEVFLVAQKAIVVKANKVLLLKTRENDMAKNLRSKWDLPGGLIEIKEELPKALAREVGEESNLKIDVDRLLAAQDYWINDFKFANGEIRSTHLIILGYICNYNQGKVKISNEHSRFRWVDQDKLNQYSFVPTINKIMMKFMNL